MSLSIVYKEKAFKIKLENEYVLIDYIIIFPCIVTLIYIHIDLL